MAQKEKNNGAKRKKWPYIVGGVAVFLLAQWAFIGWRYAFGPLQSLGMLRYGGFDGNQAEYDFSRLSPMADSPLAGKRVLFLGSSVTNGRAALYQSIPEYFAARMGCESVKEAVDGTTLVDSGKDSYIQRMLNNVDAAGRFDLVVCQLSTNDASKGKPLGEIAAGTAPDSFDTATVTGAMEYIIAYAQETWNCPVVFYTNARFESDAYPAMVARVHELSEKWGIGVLDLWSDDAFNDITPEQRALYMNDAIHPVKAGYRDWWGPELERQLCVYLNGAEE